MSIAQLNRKFDLLAVKEKIIKEFYDPVKPQKKQHRLIQDIRDDYQEDIKNYGFSKYSLKKDRTDANLITEDIQSLKARPLSALPTAKKLIRPMTAPVQDLMTSQEQINNYKTVRGKDDKYWRNTKKFDTASQAQVRNHSALQKILLEGNKQDISEQEFNRMLIEDRINFVKLNPESLQKKKSQTVIFPNEKHSPTDKDKFNLYMGFKESMTQIQQKSSNVNMNTIPLSPKSNSPVKIEEKDFKTSISPEQRHLQQQSSNQKLMNVVTDNSNKFENIKNIEKLVLQEKYTLLYQPTHNENIISVRWQEMLYTDMEYQLTVIEIKTMNNINFKIKLGAKGLQDISNGQTINFPLIFQSLFKHSEQIDNNLYPINNLYYVLVYTKDFEHKEIKYEKFYYDSQLTFPIGRKIENLFIVFYLRFLLLQDKSQTHLKDIMELSQFIIAKTSKFPNQLIDFLDALKHRQILLQDREGSSFIIDVANMLASSLEEQEQQQPEYKSLDVKLDAFLNKQSQRPSTANIKKPTSVLTLEKMNRINSGSRVSYKPSRPATADFNSIIAPKKFHLRDENHPLSPHKESDMDSFIKEQFEHKLYEHTQTQHKQMEMQHHGAHSNYAMSVNYAQENLEDVMKLILSQNSPTGSGTGIFKTPRQGLRPQTAHRKQQGSQPQVSTHKSSKPHSAHQKTQMKMITESQKYIKRVRMMANNIVIKGTKYND